MRLARLLILLTSFLLPLVAGAELYRWVDEEGRIHFGDRKPEDSASQAQEVQVEAPKPIGQDDVKHIHERLEEVRAKERERVAKEEAEAAEQEKEKQKLCQEKVRHYNRMQRNFVYERDDGSVYQVTRKQAEKDRAELRDWLDENCPGF